MKVCTAWLRCPCQCHITISDMFAKVGAPREIMENPEYRPHVSRFIMPTLEEVAAEKAKKQNENETHVTVEKSETPLAPDLSARSFRPTETGRSARGQLEECVHRACTDWVANKVIEECSTLWVQNWIREELGLEPSRGAIDAVWKRWVELGFALTLKHPTQFAAFTPDGIELGLEAIKERRRKAERLVITNQRLGRR